MEETSALSAGGSERGAEIETLSILLRQLQTAVGERYQVEREIARGGMATVFLAQDRKHTRAVAIKVLRPEIGLSAGSDRFQREIEIASRLAHPNILPLLDSGRFEDMPYFVMPFVKGESLRERLAREGRLPLAEVLRIGGEIASGLDYAHREGVVHRDIKPGNILLLDRHAVIADFGLARAATETSGGAVTRTGVTLGTPAYMSPEQAAGETDLDARSDLYSLGCVLFEMVTGQSPRAAASGSAAFQWEPPAEPPSVRRLLPEAPEWLDTLLLRLLARSKSDRIASAAELGRRLSEGDPGSTTSRSGPATAQSGRVLVLVLPFQNRSADPEQEYFSDGLTEEMIAVLGRVERRRLGVIARTSAMRYKGTEKSVRQIAEELGVDYVLEGGVRRAGNRVRITAGLVEARGQSQLWAESYERDLADVFAIQSEVAEKVAASLTSELLASEPSSRAAVAPAVSEAYLRGRYHWNQRTPGSLERARAAFEAAIALDPTFALAHAGLADTFLSLGDTEGLPVEEANRLGIEAARRALALDDTLAEPHVSLGHGMVHFWRIREAESELRHAVHLNPSLPTGHFYLAYVLAIQRRHDESVAEMRVGRDLDPHSTLMNVGLGVVLRQARRFEEAALQLRGVIEKEPERAMAYQQLAESLLACDRSEEAGSVLEAGERLAGERQAFLSLRGRWHAARGESELARAQIVRLEEMGDGVGAGPAAQAEVWAWLGEKERAFACLERAYDLRNTALAFLAAEPVMDPIRDDPRFADLLRRVGI